MASDRRSVSRTSDDPRRRPAARGVATVFRGHSVGAPHGCPLERFTKSFSLSCNLLAAAEGVDRVGRLPGSLVAAGGQTPRTEVHRLGRGDRRRHVFPSKKRGACVGKTKRGKGTKIMLLADNGGTPLA